MSDEPDATVLVVDDDPQVVGLYADLLDDAYAVLTATEGEQALSKLDEHVDVVLLDRRMPSLSGDEVLGTIRERGYDCRVAMVTAIEPGFDVLELGFDTYLVKPISKSAIHDTVQHLLDRQTYERDVRELLSLLSKRALLEAEKSPEELDRRDEYEALLADIEALRARVDAKLEALAGEHLEALFRDID